MRLFLVSAVLLFFATQNAAAFHDALHDPAPMQVSPMMEGLAGAGLMSGNPSNDKLLAMPEKGQAAMLSKATHYSCLGKNAYYMGTEKHGANKGVSFWSITCDNGGKKFMIAIKPDATGTTRVISCNLLHGKPWECYSKLKDQD